MNTLLTHVADIVLVEGITYDHLRISYNHPRNVSETHLLMKYDQR